MDSNVYFPLRSNAKMLIAGRSISIMRQRILRAAILHDLVLLEDGGYKIDGGPTGSQAWFDPKPSPRWQSTVSRSKAQAGSFHVSFRPSAAASDAPFHTIVQSEAEIAWWPTFTPFKDEIPSGNKWLQFGYVEEHPGVKREATSMFSPDKNDPELRRIWPHSFVRNMMIDHTNIDLGMGALIGAAVSYDRAHSRVVFGKLHRGEATLAMGDHTLLIEFPAELSWEDVERLRKHRGLREYRAVLREVESAARDSASSLDELEHEILREYGEALSDARARGPSFGTKVVVEMVALGVGTAAGALAGVPFGEAAGAVAGLGAGKAAELLVRPRWLAVHQQLESGQRRSVRVGG